MEFTEVESSDIVCVDLDGDWSVKIIDNYGHVDFLQIKDNLKNKETIYDISDIFEHLILPPKKEDVFGNIIYWSIADNQNLYTLNPLPYDYWNKRNNPPCPQIESESEAWEDPNIINRVSNYFDTTISNF